MKHKSRAPIPAIVLNSTIRWVMVLSAALGLLCTPIHIALEAHFETGCASHPCKASQLSAHADFAGISGADGPAGDDGAEHDSALVGLKGMHRSAPRVRPADSAVAATAPPGWMPALERVAEPGHEPSPPESPPLHSRPSPRAPPRA
ncbi:MAG: hypothetical protein HYZ53_05185 [Planctomycetes bacterium]|nr:hypothetical protein [Planctomycetota bacterium]